MPVAPPPAEIFERAVDEGERRLDQSTLELVSTSFIAGFTVVFGVVFLVGGRAELFNENSFDPVAAAVDRSDAWLLRGLLGLWALTLAGNLVGGLGLVTLTHVAQAMGASESDG